MTSAVLTLKIINTGRSKNPARASTDVSTVLGPSLCIVEITNICNPGSALRVAVRVDPGDEAPGSTSRTASVGRLAVPACSDRRLADRPAGRPDPAAAGRASAGHLGWDCLVGSCVAPSASRIDETPWSNRCSTRNVGVDCRRGPLRQMTYCWGGIQQERIELRAAGTARQQSR
jgi:hypothetical protein